MIVSPWRDACDGATAVADGPDVVAMESIHQFAAGVLAEIIRRQPASREKTSFSWELAVGPALARVTSVDLRNGVLFVVARDDRWAREIRRAAPAILAKLQHLLGADVVHSIHT